MVDPAQNSVNPDKYHRILEAAIGVFAEQGFFNATVSKIARAAGVADGTIYLYFKNKNDILLHFFNYKTKEVFGTFRHEVDKGGNAREKLRNLIKAHLREFQKDRNMAVVFQAEARQIRYFEVYIKDLTNMYFDLVGEIVVQGQEESVFRRGLDPSLVKRFILGTVDEVINTWLHAARKYDLEAQADAIVDLFVNGIGATPPK
ncbi:TetR/AcrR family transcriptional regulator [Desulfosudis oleivorans]|uniref:Transcriptional regulator, TetR family n=1 Tax=Desulfosudis oleivorans (strain DSM 6200 / JCM 39069 / Hxd3) TaxID=96561 RepID=A8ZVI4_DESOH|nr:TetR/AcrR family transcriptional regulator [Desulfosudis oleivorans]ABW68171.1 transcriptional regulator, TetR family [Desulfosudis oleivorans Hxd3]